MLGRAATARIIVSGRNSRERSKNRTVQQLGSRESVSIIETITADGSYLPPFLIWQGQQHQETWYQITEHNKRLRGYAYATSTNSWTDDSLGLYYIKHYDKYTRQLIEDAKGNI